MTTRQDGRHDVTASRSHTYHRAATMLALTIGFEFAFQIAVAIAVAALAAAILIPGPEAAAHSLR